MRPSAPLAVLASLALVATQVVAAPAQPPPDNVVTRPHPMGVLVDWTRSTVPVESWTMFYEVMRQELAPDHESDFRPVGKVPPSTALFVDTTAQDTAAYLYCVRAVTVDGPQQCSEPVPWIDLADCLLVYGSYSVDADTHCLYTADPPLPIPYPWCAPFGAHADTSPSASATPRTGCLWIDP